MKNWGKILGLLMLVALPTFVFALPVEDLYSHELIVQNQSDAERRRAYREALAAVMLKVTGESRWLQQPALQSALNNAQSYVQEVGFRTGVQQVVVAAPVNSNNPDDTISPVVSTVPAIYINVRFSRTLIDDLLDASNVPIWDRNRPSVLVWLSVQNAAGERTVLGSDSDHPALEIIREFSRQRGVPFLIPTLDFTDRRNMSADRAWTLDEQIIRTSSERYGADSILAGRILVTPTGELVGLWQFQFRDTVDTFDGLDTELNAYMQMPLDRVVNRLAAHFSIVRNTLQSTDSVILRVDNIRNIANFDSLVSYVQDLAVVRSVTVSRLSSDSLELQVNLSGTRNHLREFISLDRDLATVPGAADANPDYLHYRWTR